MEETKIQELDAILSQIDNLNLDIERFTALRDELNAKIDNGKNSGYKTPSERFAIEKAENEKRKLLKETSNKN